MLLFWLATVSVLGAGTLTCLGLGPRRRCDAATGSLALSIVLAVSLGKILLLAGAFRPPAVTIGAALCLAAASAWLVLDDAAADRATATLALWRRRPSVRVAPLAWVCAAALTAAFGYFGFLATHLPPVAWDALYYHLISVSQWVRTGHLVSPVPGMASRPTDVLILTQADSFPHDTELVAAWFAVFTHNVRLVQLAQLVFLPMLFSGVYGLSRHLGARARWAILGGSVAVLAPVVLSQAATNYVDVAQASALAAGWQFLVAAFPLRPDQADLRRGSADRRRRHLLIAGLCLGLAAGVKSQGLVYCGVALLLVVVLSARQTRAVLKGTQPRWDVPSPARACAALAVPMIAMGSFWYVRTWLRWGSPTWPITIGPFGGRTGLTQWDNVGGLAIPVPWRGSGFLELLARDWAAALPFLRPAGLGDYGTPGLVWLLACLPAIAACLLIRKARRRHRYALAVVVLPLTLVTVVSPVGWHARLAIPLLIAGGVALAVLLDAGLPAGWARQAGSAGWAGLTAGSASRASRAGRADGGASPAEQPGEGIPAALRTERAGHRAKPAGKASPGRPAGGLARRLAGPPGRAGASLAGAAVLVLVLWQAVDQAAHPSWNVPAGVDGFRAVLSLARSPLQERMDTGHWQAWNAVQASMTEPGGIGFFSQDPPDFTLPYAGQDFSRAVVSIGPWPWPGHGPQPTDAVIAKMMARAQVRYLYLVPGTVPYQVLTSRRSTQLRTITTFDPASAAFGGSVLERFSADLVRHRRPGRAR